MKQIAVLGGSFGPPGLHHRNIVLRLLHNGEFDEVIMVPCGPRPDKLTTNDISPLHRAVMADLTFGGIPRVTVDLADLERDVFTRSIDLVERYKDRGEVWLVIGSDLVDGGWRHESVIQREWHEGCRLWNEAKFVIVARDTHPIDDQHLPVNSRIIVPAFNGASHDIRERIFNHQPFENLVDSQVAAYIKRHGLYHGMLPSNNAMHVRMDNPRVQLEVDTQNPAAMAIARPFTELSVNDDPNCIVVIGGDGYMLSVIRKYWRSRLPFIGVNAGHLGFLMNGTDEISSPEAIFEDLSIVQTPMLYVESDCPDGSVLSQLAFNDCWTRSRNGGQAAKTEISVNGRVRIPTMVSDGVLVATPAGSTSYARAMGAKPLPVGSPHLIMVGSNVFMPFGWQPVYLPLETTVSLRSLETDRRSVEAFVDGVSLGETHELRARISRIAAPELAFLPGHDMQEKILRLQFPFS